MASSLVKAALGLLAGQANNALEQHITIDYTREQRIANCVQISALGDAQGRVTEFIKSTNDIFKRYPEGIKSFADFKKSDWKELPARFQPPFYSSQGIAPYTDDTRMALLVAEQLIEAKKGRWDLNKTMSELTKAFIKDKDDSLYGWAAPFRAPGNACLNGVRKAEQMLARGMERGSGSPRWWDAQATQAGGCGSVMRAYPFGLVFADNIAQAKEWAVEHSKITHGHPIALAACAAMAVGIAHAINGKKHHDEIIQIMSDVAHEYDHGTSAKIRKAVEYAVSAKQQLGRFESIYTALISHSFRAFHEKVFNEFQAWAADDAIAAAVYVWKLFPSDYESALYTAVHTPGDSDSIAAMVGALVGASTRSGHPINFDDSLEDAQQMRYIARLIAQT